jgi:hypothetical protein
MLPCNKHCFVASVLAATVAVDVKEVFSGTGHPHVEVPVPLLRATDCMTIARHLSLPNSLIDSPDFVQLLADVGGVPRLLRAVLTGVRQASGDAPLTDGTWLAIRKRVQAEIANRNRLDGRPGVDEVVRAVLTRALVKRTEKPSNRIDVETYGSLEERGAVFLQHSDTPDLFFVSMPYLLLENVVGGTRYAKTVVADLFSFPSLSKFEWQTFEKFHAVYEAACTMMFAETHSTVSLSRFYRGALFVKEPDDEFEVKSPARVFGSRHQFPHVERSLAPIDKDGKPLTNWEDGRNIFINAKGAAFDVFSCHPGRPSGLVFRAAACRFSEKHDASAVMPAELEKECDKTLEALDALSGNRRVVFGFFTNRLVNVGPLRPRCFVVGRNQLTGFYGHVFGYRLPFAAWRGCHTLLRNIK